MEATKHYKSLGVKVYFSLSQKVRFHFRKFTLLCSSAMLKSSLDFERRDAKSLRDARFLLGEFGNREYTVLLIICLITCSLQCRRLVRELKLAL